MVLLIEDDVDHAEMVVEILRDHLPPIKVEVAATGEDGLARIEPGRYDLVILDYRLPDGDGLFWLGKIVEREPDLPVVMVTSQGSEGVAAEAFRRGAWDYLVKSIDYLDLLPQAMERILERARLLHERQEMERQAVATKNKLEAIFGAITDFIILLDRDFTIQEINHRLTRTTGRPSSQLIGRHCYQELAHREETCPDCPAQKVFETGLPASATRPLPCHGGPLQEVHISAYPLKDERGEVIGVVEYVRDVTEERRALRQLAQSRRLSALGETVSSIAHEVENPLQNFRLGFDLLKGELGEQGSLSSLLQRMEQRMKIIEAIVGELLDYSRSLELHRSPCDLRQVVEGALSEQKALLEARGIRVHRDWGEVPYEALGDPMRLRQVLANLLSNALEAMGADGELRISLGWQTFQGQEWLSLEVADTGCGIPPQDLERVFDPFFTTKGNGVGLGMAIAHRLIELHQGHLDVRSQVGQGTTFTVLLPLAKLGDREQGTGNPGSSPGQAGG